MTNVEALERVAEEEGFSDAIEMLEEYAVDSVVPGICPICGYTGQFEPDQESGWCEECGKATCKSIFVLAGII